MQWSNESASGATSYDYELVAKSGPCDFTSATPTNTSSTSATVGPLAGGDYCWRVRSIDAYNNPSSYSTPFTFTLDTTPPTVPTLTSPADGSTTGDTTPTVQWSNESASGATSYDYELVAKSGPCDFTSATPTNTSSTSASGRAAGRRRLLLARPLDRRLQQPQLLLDTIHVHTRHHPADRPHPDQPGRRVDDR